MIFSKKVLSLASGVVAALSVAAAGQPQQQPSGSSSGRQPKAVVSGDSIVIGGTIDWMEKSDVSALREGVIEKIEFQVGNRVEAGKPIGVLHKRMAELTAKKAEVAANNIGPIESAKAKKKLAMSEVARLRRLEKMGKGFVSESEIQKAEAEVQVAEAMELEGTENQKVARAELDVANEIVDEHTILAPFTGIITDRIKNPGEAIRANEAVVRLGRTDKLRFQGYLPFESSSRVQVGDNVEVHATIDGAILPVEQKEFHGKVISVSRDVSTIREARVQVVAEVNDAEDVNNPDLSLRPGLRGEMKILLRVPAAPPAVGLRTAR